MAIKEINSLSEVINNLSNNTLLLVDIDNTLIKAKDESDPNLAFSHLLHVYIQTGEFKVDKNNNFKSYFNKYYHSLVENYNKQIKDTIWKTTEYSTKNYFNLWKRYYTVYGITARGIEIYRETADELRKHRIEFDNAYPFQKTYSGVHHFQANCNGRAGMKRKNILFCGGADKGKVLLEWLGWDYHCQFDKVVMVDDSITELGRVQRVLELDNKVEFIGLHYVQS